MGKNVSALAVSLIILALSGSAASDIILNGTDFYLSTGDSYGLPQGYVVKLKSVSNEDSIWLELESNDTIVKSEIVHLKDYFTYNKTNRTILSLRVDNIYSGSKDTNLVSFFPVYQYTDPDMPAPKIIVITPVKTTDQDNHSAPPPEQPIPEFMIWITAIIFVITLFYIGRKLW
ncbi:MAG TPA: S-layer protein domain-containing protein [Candidatus Methanoperedens sp.]